MKTYKNLFCICLAAIQLITFVCCAKEEDTGDGEGLDEVIEEAPAPERDYCRIDGEDIYFIGGEELQALREPLIKLLANRKEKYYQEGADVQYIPPDPDSPAIEGCYRCGLFDVTADGVPELFIPPWGFEGSSGVVDYYVYDIKTGEKIEQISTGYGSYCCYFDTERRALALVENSGSQIGWYMKSTYLYVRIYDSAKGEYVSDLNISADYVLDVPSANENRVEYFIDYKPASWHDYQDLLDRFYMNYVRIPETELTMIDWSEVSKKDDDRFVSAQKMADALLASEQKYVIPNKDNSEKDFGEELCLTKSN